MGLSAEILAVGPFSRDVQGFLEFPAPYYAGTQDGAVVLCFMYGVTFTSAVQELYACLRHGSGRFDPFAVDLPRLKEISRRFVLRNAENDLPAFLALREHGFVFHVSSEVPNLSAWQQRNGSRMSLSAQILSVPTGSTDAECVDAFYFEAASDRDVGDRFSCGLAQAFRLDPWNFNQHFIATIPSKADLEPLTHLVDGDETLAWEVKKRMPELISWLEEKQGIGHRLLFLPARWRSR